MHLRTPPTLLLAAIVALPLPSANSGAPALEQRLHVTESGKFSAASIAAWKATYEALEAEHAANPNHAWAGVYYHGDGMGVNATLQLAPESGFTFLWTGCLGVYDLNYGPVELKPDGTIKLTFRQENDQRGFKGCAEEFVPVRWGQRAYLLDPQEIPSFVSDVLAGREPRTQVHGLFMLRKDDHQKPATGRPELPPAFTHLLESPPIEATVFAVSEPVRKSLGQSLQSCEVTLTIDAGRDKGLFKGLKIHSIDPVLTDVFGAHMELIRVREHESTATWSQILLERQEPTLPMVGWRISTKPPKTKNPAPVGQLP